MDGKVRSLFICGTEGLSILKNSIFPEGALINIGTPKRPDIDHRPCVAVGNMRNRGSIDPQISNRPYSAQRISGRPSGLKLLCQVLVLVGRLRNSK